MKVTMKLGLVVLPTFTTLLSPDGVLKAVEVKQGKAYGAGTVTFEMKED